MIVVIIVIIMIIIMIIIIRDEKPHQQQPIELLRVRGFAQRPNANARAVVFIGRA